MILRALALAVGLLVGLAASQGPEFAQQYRQRLGGAIDELRRVATRFDDSAREAGLSPAEAAARLRGDPDLLVRRQGDAASAVAERLGRLERQRAAMAEAGPFARLLVLVREADPDLARAAYLDFEPAWPATGEGLASGAAGFLIGWLGVLFAGRIGRRLTPSRRARPRPV